MSEEKDENKKVEKNSPEPVREYKPGSERFGYEKTDLAESTTLYVGDLEESVTEDEMRDILKDFGKIVSLKKGMAKSRAKLNPGFCFVEFEKRNEAEEAYEKLEKMEIKGVKIKVDWDLKHEKKPRRRNNRGYGRRYGGYRRMRDYSPERYRRGYRERYSPPRYYRNSPDRRRYSPERDRRSPPRYRRSPERRRYSPERRRSRTPERRRSPERRRYDSPRRDYDRRDRYTPEHRETRKRSRSPYSRSQSPDYRSKKQKI